MTAALISATVALLIFAWTQWMTGLRARHDLLCEKLEELCRSIVGLRSKIIKATRAHLPSNIDGQKEVIAEIDQGLVDDILSIQMLSSLYFPVLSERIARLAAAAESTIGRREFYGGHGGEVTSFQIIVNSNSFQSLTANTHELIGYVNLEYASLTETPKAKLSAIWSGFIN